MEHPVSRLSCFYVTLTILAWIAGVLADVGSAPPQADVGSAPPQADVRPSVQDCKFVSMSWKPQFGASHTVKASQKLPDKTVVSEDDSVVVNVETTCDISSIAYASVIFTAPGQSSSKVVLMKQGKTSKHLKGQLKAADLKFLGGTVDVSIAVGDAAIKPLQWQAGVVGILDRSGDSLIPNPTPTRHWAQFEKLPPLQHTFRPDQASLPAVVPIIASSVVAMPLVMLCYMLFVKMESNISGISDSIYSLLFVAGIAATLGLGVWFWIRMRLMDLFMPLGGLSLFMVVVGHQALRRIADKRLASEKEKAE